MFDQTRTGYILPEDFAVIATAFEKVVSARNIGRHSDEADCLARRAIRLYMDGTRNEWELELRLRNSCRQFFEHTSRHAHSSTQVVDLLPQLSAWARSLTSSPEDATALTERTLQHAIDHMAEFVETSDVRRWLVRIMVQLRLGHSLRHRRRSPDGL
ncbi:sigma factor [Ensifer sp. ZNC0028]|uniref:sigma factor n=1 Tax=Ensifer sp. ZNC0028 TaxID=1339236 RepID=UPI0005B7E1F3|nr:sigma factor [Ensifer sp. ZNC0028]